MGLISVGVLFPRAPLPAFEEPSHHVDVYLRPGGPRAGFVGPPRFGPNIFTKHEPYAFVSALQTSDHVDLHPYPKQEAVSSQCSNLSLART